MTETSQFYENPPFISSLLEDEEEDYFDYFYDEPGSEPGTLNIEPDAHPSKIVLIDYNEHQAIRKVDLIPNALTSYLGTNTVSWMDVQGFSDPHPVG